MDNLLDDPVQIYLREVTLIPPMTPEQEAACIEHLLAGDQEAERARRNLMEAHLATVVSIAQQHKNDSIHVLDLIQKGNNGLMRALETFPQSHGETFSIHATLYIERAIKEAVAESGPTGL